MSINVVIDISHYNDTVNFAKVKEANIVGVIHKATQGVSGIDPKYNDNRKAALKEGLLWGAYHFGTGCDGVEQAKHFLSVAAPDKETLLVLDFEQNPACPSMNLVKGHTFEQKPACPSMNLAEAEAFINHVKEATGRYPGFYSGDYIKQCLESTKDSLNTLSNCWFWLAHYGNTPTVPSPWPTWTMWQYTDGIHCSEPHDVYKGFSCDRDRFNGDLDGLYRLWKV